MIDNPTLIQAKSNMEAADAMHDYLCQTHGECSDAAMYALQASLASFMVLCEIERLLRDES